MELSLYESSVCRLCGEENENGYPIYSGTENEQTLCDIINTYLPIKVSDDGILPRTICPGCSIQLEATVEFLNIIISGQKILRELQKKEKVSKHLLPTDADSRLIYEISTSNGVYSAEHPKSLQVCGLDKPKRKRGRPPKKQKTPEELALEDAEQQNQMEVEIQDKLNQDNEEVSGKRRRKVPTRYKEAVQGKELERIFIEEGVIDDEDGETDKNDNVKPAVDKEPEVIGTKVASGELVVVVKGKGRGRPKGRIRQLREECTICGMVFSSVGGYMSHIAQHGPVMYQCGQCQNTFYTKLDFREHQKKLNHEGKNIITGKDQNNVIKDPHPTSTTTVQQNDDIVEVKAESANMPCLTEPNVSAEDVKHDLNIETNAIMDPLKIKDQPTPGKNPCIPEENENPKDVRAEEDIVVETKGKVRLKCDQCEKTFSNRQSKSMHIKAAHNGERPYVCAECGAKFAYPRSLSLHVLSHRRHKGAKGYACDLCGKVLNHPSSVVYHKEAEHAGHRYACNKCNKMFKHKQLLQRHQLVHTQERPFTCKTCDASFKTKANLLNHTLLHYGVKRFTCEICKQRFAHKTSLKLHMRWHTGVKPYSCSMCGKCFTQKGNLSEHERIHTGEKPFQCPYCPRRFTTSSQQRTHIHTHRLTGARTAVMQQRRLRSRVMQRLHQQPQPSTEQPRTKQISLLANESNEMRENIEFIEFQQPSMKEEDDQELSVIMTEESEVQDAVIYLAYDVEDNDAESITMFNGEQLSTIEQNEVLSTCELYPGTSVLMQQGAEENILMRRQVINEQGQPLHLTMEDGTQLAVTSVDGTSFQVVTQDGQTIPIQINQLNESTEDTKLVPELTAEEPSERETPSVAYFTII